MRAWESCSETQTQKQHVLVLPCSSAHACGKEDKTWGAKAEGVEKERKTDRAKRTIKWNSECVGGLQHRGITSHTLVLILGFTESDEWRKQVCKKVVCVDTNWWTNNEKQFHTGHKLNKWRNIIYIKYSMMSSWCFVFILFCWFADSFIFTQESNSASPVLLPSPRGPWGGDLYRVCSQVRQQRSCNICTKIYL